MDVKSAGLLGLAAFIIITGSDGINAGNWSASGLFVAIVTVLLSVWIYAFFLKKGFTIKMPDSVPDKTLRYKELERKVVGITPTMITKCLRELETDELACRKQYPTIPPTVEYTLAPRGQKLIPALEEVYRWADAQMQEADEPVASADDSRGPDVV